jgi:alpha-galactosidase/6-phospho-beta-glucosidase family protein
MSRPKIVIIGAGSYFFGKALVWNMAKSPVLRNGTLAMVDTNSHVLETMMTFGKRVFNEMGAQVKVIGSTDRRDVLKDADFVVLSFSERNAHYRGIDCEISKKYGIKMCSGDTIGPGGIFRSLREIPHALEMAKDIAELAPKAWTINYVNPTSVLGIALMRYAPELKSFAICDAPHHPHNHLRLLKRTGIIGEDAAEIPADIQKDLDIKIMGLNHFTWVTTFTYKGEDMLPVLREKIAEAVRKEEHDRASAETDNNSNAKRKNNAAYTLHLMDMFGVYPDRMGHTKEYVSYFQGYGVLPNQPEPITVFDAKTRAQQMASCMKELEEFADGSRPITEFTDKGQIDHATDIIESMWGGLGKAYYVNTPNRGAVTNMADDAFLELQCDLDMESVTPRKLGEMPRGLLGLEQQVLDTHELTAEAAVTCDKKLLLRAMVTDPIINNYEDAKMVMEELLEAEKDVLPSGWYEKE